MTGFGPPKLDPFEEHAQRQLAHLRAGLVDGGQGDVPEPRQGGVVVSHEGNVPYMYVDKVGLVTAGIGTMMDKRFIARC